MYKLITLYPGEEGYAPSYSDEFKVEIGGAILKVIIPPPGQIDVGQTLYFTGQLVDKKGGIGIPNKPIKIYWLGGLDSTIYTDFNGTWLYKKECSSAGRYFVSAKFEEDDEFLGDATVDYDVVVGTLRQFGCTEIGRTMSGCDSRIVGTTFRCPEEGTAQSIVVYGGFGLIEDTPTIMRCALYRRSDMTLVCKTKARIFSRRNIGWYGIMFQEPPKVSASEEYIVVGLADHGAYMMYDNVPSAEGIVQQGKITLPSILEPSS